MIINRVVLPWGASDKDDVERRVSMDVRRNYSIFVISQLFLNTNMTFEYMVNLKFEIQAG